MQVPNAKSSSQRVFCNQWNSTGHVFAPSCELTRDKLCRNARLEFGSWEQSRKKVQRCERIVKKIESHDGREPYGGNVNDSFGLSSSLVACERHVGIIFCKIEKWTGANERQYLTSSPISLICIYKLYDLIQYCISIFYLSRGLTLHTYQHSGVCASLELEVSLCVNINTAYRLSVSVYSKEVANRGDSAEQTTEGKQQERVCETFVLSMRIYQHDQCESFTVLTKTPRQRQQSKRRTAKPT